MLHKFFNSFDPDTGNDPHFGAVELHYNDAEKTYYLMKDVDLGNYPEKLSLTVESTTRQSSQQQAEIFKLIESNFLDLLDTSRSYMAERPEMKDNSHNFEAEAIYIGTQAKNSLNWELSLINVDGSSYCIIEWQGLKPVNLSIEE